jgi:hypothetical protein
VETVNVYENDGILSQIALSGDPTIPVRPLRVGFLRERSGVISRRIILLDIGF